jgi:hypothetical protein
MSDSEPRHTQPNHTLQCAACHRVVSLRLRERPPATRAWRTFTCPHCRAENFVRLAAEILDVNGGEPNA